MNSSSDPHCPNGTYRYYHNGTTSWVEMACCMGNFFHIFIHFLGIFKQDRNRSSAKRNTDSWLSELASSVNVEWSGLDGSLFYFTLMLLCVHVLSVPLHEVRLLICLKWMRNFLSLQVVFIKLNWHIYHICLNSCKQMNSSSDPHCPNGTYRYHHNGTTSWVEIASGKGNFFHIFIFFFAKS